MNGAEALARTLVAAGIEVCFANPGTSEMHFVSALDRVPGLRCVLGLAETVVAGCADGYGRMAGKPAATLLHCGPGLANGIANFHNARRAFTPIVGIVGDHATYHRAHDAPLTADTEGLARTVSHWVRTSASAATVAPDAAAAVQAARSPPGGIATLVLPADCAWDEGAQPAAALAAPRRAAPAPETIRDVARALRSGEAAMLVLSNEALGEAGLRAAQRVAHASGARLRTPTQVPRMARGRGRPPVDRIPYVVDAALKVLQGTRHLILAGAKAPVGFFAYPGKPSTLWPPDCTLHVLARVKQDAVTSGRALFAATFAAAPHDWIQLTGGAIGHAFPAATGAAVACPQRKVVCLQADGAGMYSLQALWTQARERLDVVNVVFANRRYAILQGELAAVGATPGPASRELFDLARPEIRWTQFAEGLGVEAVRVATLEAFADAFGSACARRGPFLIEFAI